jgi:hypothetical protein
VRSIPTDPACYQYQRDLGSPVDVLSISHENITISPPSDHMYPTVVVDKNAQTWDEYIVALPAWETLLIQGCHQLDDRFPLWMYITDEQANIYAVSDGGVKYNIGTYGWVIATSGKVLVTGQGGVFGRNISSHRAEVCGILSWMLYLYHYTKFLQLEIKCAIHSFCNNKAAISNVNNFTLATRNSMIPDFDIIQEANMIFGSLKNTAKRMHPILHVKGHQDRNVPEHKLSWPAILNIKADKLATEAMEHAAIRSPSMEVTNNPIRLQMDSEIITSNEQEILRWRWREFVLQEYLETKFKLTHLELHTINWAAIHIARKRLPSELQPFSVKLMIKWLPVGTRMAKYGNNMTMCYFCNNDEDFNHLFCCSKKRHLQQKFVDELDTELQRTGTQLEIRTALHNGITEWMTQTKINTKHTSAIYNAIQQQEKIGWHRTICGLFGNEWAKLQEQHEPNKWETVGKHPSAHL